MIPTLAALILAAAGAAAPKNVILLIAEGAGPATSDHETGGLRISETKKARFRMEWSTTDHTGTVVPIFAFGPGSGVFAGLQDNADVGKKLAAAVEGGN